MLESLGSGEVGDVFGQTDACAMRRSHGMQRIKRSFVRRLHDCSCAVSRPDRWYPAYHMRYLTACWWHGGCMVITWVRRVDEQVGDGKDADVDVNGGEKKFATLTNEVRGGFGPKGRCLGCQESWGTRSTVWVTMAEVTTRKVRLTTGKRALLNFKYSITEVQINVKANVYPLFLFY